MSAHFPRLTFRLAAPIATAAALLAAPLALPVAAQNMLIPSPENVAEILRQFGSVEIAVAESGRPRLDADVDGLFYGAVLYGCEEDRNACDSIDYYAFFNSTPLAPEAYNRWNDEFRFGTAIDGGDGEALLVMTQNLEGGVTVDNLIDTFEQYRESLNRFDAWAYSGGPNPPFPSDDTAPAPGAPPK